MSLGVGYVTRAQLIGEASDLTSCKAPWMSDSLTKLIPCVCCATAGLAYLQGLCIIPGFKVVQAEGFTHIRLL
jgi:hypothetical protein